MRLCSLPVPPQWAFSESLVLLATGAFLMQVMVQGAWGVIPVHLNELSPDEARGTFPAFVRQIGNLLASADATIQAGIAMQFGGNYGLALALVAGSVAIIIAVLTSRGGRRGRPSAPLAGDRLPLERKVRQWHCKRSIRQAGRLSSNPGNQERSARSPWQSPRRYRNRWLDRLAT
jgi:hypothetical protein